MAAAAWVGRVGGLAVALGIGAAMATGGLSVAWADGGHSAAASHASRNGAGPFSASPDCGAAGQQAPTAGLGARCY